MTNPIMYNCRTASPCNGPSGTSGSEERLPPPPKLVGAIAAMQTGCDEQTSLLRQLVQQGATRGMVIIFTISRLFLGIMSS